MCRALWAAVGPPVPSIGIRELSVAGLQSHTQAAGGTHRFSLSSRTRQRPGLKKKDLQGRVLEPLPQGGPWLWASPGKGGGGAVQRVFPQRASLSSLPRRPLAPLISITGQHRCSVGCTHAAMSLAKTFLQIFFMGIEKK